MHAEWMRWHLLRTDDGWRIYDHQNLNLGRRATQLMAARARAGDLAPRRPPTPSPPRLDQPLVRLNPPPGSLFGASHPETRDDAFQVRMAKGYVESNEPRMAQQYLDQVDPHRLEWNDELIYWIVQITASLQAGNPRQAVAHCDRLEARAPGTLIARLLRTRALVAWERVDEAQAAAQALLDEFGPDADIYLLLATCHAARDDMAAARAACEQALDDNPNHVQSLVLYGKALPRFAKAPLVERFFAMPHPEEHLAKVIEELADLEELTAAAALVTAWVERHGDDPQRRQELADAVRAAGQAAQRLERLLPE